jgi:hypothetical protein
VETDRRPKLACFAAFVATSAFGGAAGLVTGALDFGARVNQRLPFGSPVFAALALSATVGIPSTALAIRAGRGDDRTATAARVAGWLLIAWIAIEVAFIREFSFLQVVYGTAGIAYVVLARVIEHNAVDLDASPTTCRRSDASFPRVETGRGRPPAST